MSPKRGSVQRFKTFDEAREALNHEGYERGLVVEDARRLFDTVHRLSPHRYQPGLKKFRSFQEANESALRELIESSVK